MSAPAEEALRLSDVRYRYPETEQDAIQGMDLRVGRGEWVAIIGPTNSGKSTLCYLVMGLAPHFFGGRLQGGIFLFGQDARPLPVAQRSVEVGLLFQNPFTQISGARERVRDEVAFGPECHGIPPSQVVERVAEALALVGLEELADRHPLDLSGGQLQRLALAGILAMRPRLLVLDEPTSQLDPAGAAAMFQVLTDLHRRGTTILMVEHKLEALAELCPRVLALDKGRQVADGRPQEVFNDAAVAASAGLPAYTRLARSAGLAQPWPVTLGEAAIAFGRAHAPS